MFLSPLYKVRVICRKPLGTPLKGKGDDMKTITVKFEDILIKNHPIKEIIIGEKNNQDTVTKEQALSVSKTTAPSEALDTTSYSSNRPKPTLDENLVAARNEKRARLYYFLLPSSFI